MEANEYATLYDHEDSFWWYRGLHQLVAETLRAEFARPGAPLLDRPRRLLDAGCGTGGLIARLSSLGDWSGLDWSPQALAYARRRGPTPLVRGSVERLPYRDGSFDAIVSLDVLYHREVGSDAAALREFQRCLRPGGLLFLNLPAYESLRSSHDEAIHTARRYRRATLARLLREAGLEPRRVTHWNTLLFPGLALVRRLRRPSRPAAATARNQPPPPPSSAPVTSDVSRLPAPLNALLEAILALERPWLRRRDLPFGLSILAVAERARSSGERR